MNNKKFKKRSLDKHWSPAMTVIFILLMLYTILLFIPLIWGGISSLKTDMDFRNNMFGLPKTWAFSNYPKTFFGFFTDIEAGIGYRNVYLPEQFLNSLLYALGCSFFATYVPCLVGYLTAKFRYKFSKILTTVVIVCMTLPVIGALPSEIQMAKAFGLYDHIWGMWIMKANFLSMYFLVFQSMFAAVPQDFSEAAKMDGASNYRIFFHIMMPLVSKTFLTVYLLNFIGFWNDYQTPLIFMPNRPTVSYGLYLFNRKTDGNYSTIPLKLAGSFIVIFPVLIIFGIFQKRFMGNIAMGGLK